MTEGELCEMGRKRLSRMRFLQRYVHCQHHGMLNWSTRNVSPLLRNLAANSAFKLRLARGTGKQICQLINDDLKPSQILTKEAFINAIAVDMALGWFNQYNCAPASIAKEAGLSVPLSGFWFENRQKIPHICSMIPAEFMHLKIGRSGREFQLSWATQKPAQPKTNNSDRENLWWEHQNR